MKARETSGRPELVRIKKITEVFPGKDKAPVVRYFDPTEPDSPYGPYRFEQNVPYIDGPDEGQDGEDQP